MSVTSLAKDASRAKTRRGWGLPLVLLCGAGLVWGGRAWWTDHRYKSAMKEIESDIMGGRYGTACRNLEQLLSWKADSNGGIVYLLGSCELARGRKPEADRAWARVAPGTAFADRAIRGRMRLFHESGQLSDAERLIQDAATDRRNARLALLPLLVPMYIQLGRDDEARRIIEDRWTHLNALGEGALDPAIKLLRQHIELTKPPPVESVRAYLDHVAELAPKDDRVWLGQANLAIRTGAHEEAGRLLDACLAAPARGRRDLARRGCAGVWPPTGPRSSGRP